MVCIQFLIYHENRLFSYHFCRFVLSTGQQTSMISRKLRYENFRKHLLARIEERRSCCFSCLHSKQKQDTILERAHFGLNHSIIVFFKI